MNRHQLRAKKREDINRVLYENRRLPHSELEILCQQCHADEHENELDKAFKATIA